MTKEFNLKQLRRELFEEELLGKLTGAGRIYRKIIAQDKEFIKRLKGKLTEEYRNEEQVIEAIDELTGENK